MKKLITILMLSLLVFSCAKKREDRPLPYDKLTFSKSDFSGEWYLGETITNTNDASGMLVAMMAKGRLVKFKITEKFLVMYNVDPDTHASELSKNTGERIVDGDILSRFPIIKHFDIVRGKDIHEEETNVFVEESDNPHRPWNKRNKIRVDLSAEEAESRPAKFFQHKYQEYFKYFENGGDIIKVDFKKNNYIDFIVTKQIKNPSNGVNDIFELRKFFLKVNKSNYTPKEMHEDWVNHIGFFTTETTHFNEYKVPFKKQLIDRWNPKSEHVTYYLSESWNSDIAKKYKPLMYQAVEEWNKVFKKAIGKDDYIVLKESDGSQTLGDVRYNIIEWVSKSNGFLGFGPHVVNPRTGEILNANIVIDGGAYLQSFYFKSKQDEAVANWQEESNYEGMAIGSNLLPQELKSESISDFQNLLYDMTNGDLNNVSSNFKDVTKMFSSFFKEIHKENGKSRSEMNAIAIGMSDIASDFRRSEMASKLRYKNFSKEEYFKKQFLNTFIHEMGHTLGLTHNFRASMDKKNFYPEKNKAGQHLYAQTSVMDYYDDPATVLTKAGKYDYAVIKMGYNDDLKHDLSKNKNDDLEGDEYFKKKFPFEFCWDIHVNSDPLCNRFDQGTTADEIAHYYLKEYTEGYPYRNKVYTHLKRYYNRNFHLYYMMYLANRYFVPMRTFLDFWAHSKMKSMGIEKEMENGLAFHDFTNELQIDEYEEKEKAFLESEKGKDLTKAVETSMNFMFSALYNPHEDLTKINANGEVERTGTLFDRYLALTFLNMGNVGAVVNGLSHFNHYATYASFMDDLDRKPEFLQSYTAILNGVFYKYDASYGFDTSSTADLHFAFPFIRIMAASSMIGSGILGKDTLSDFKILIDDDSRSKIVDLKKIDKDLEQEFSNLKRKFMPVTLLSELPTTNTAGVLTLEHLMGGKLRTVDRYKLNELMAGIDNLKKSKKENGEESNLMAMFNISSEMSIIFEEYGDPREIQDLSDLEEKIHSKLKVLESQVEEYENTSKENKELERSILRDINKVKKMTLFDGHLGNQIELMDVGSYKERFTRLFEEHPEISTSEMTKYSVTSYNALDSYNETLLKFRQVKEVDLGIREISGIKLSKINFEIGQQIHTMKRKFTPIVDPINLYNKGQLLMLRDTYTLRPVYKRMYDEDPQDFILKVKKISRDKLEQEYMRPMSNLSQDEKKLIDLIDEMLVIYKKLKTSSDTLKNIVRQIYLEKLVVLNEKLLMKRQMLNGKIVGIIDSQTYEKLLSISKKKNKFSAEYFAGKDMSLEYLKDLEQLEYRRERILQENSVIRLIDFHQDRIIETSATGPVSTLANRINAIDSMIEVMKQEDGNEKSIENIEYYKDYELYFLSVLRDIYRESVPGVKK